jgi:hypothetical protein
VDRALGVDHVLEVVSAGSVPAHPRVFGVPDLRVKVEVVMDSIEEGARSSVEFSIIQSAVKILVFCELGLDSSQNALLGMVLPVCFSGPGKKRVIVVAVSVYI